MNCNICKIGITEPFYYQLNDYRSNIEFSNVNDYYPLTWIKCLNCHSLTNLTSLKNINNLSKIYEFEYRSKLSKTEIYTKIDKILRLRNQTESYKRSIKLKQIVLNEIDADLPYVYDIGGGLGIDIYSLIKIGFNGTLYDISKQSKISSRYLNINHIDNFEELIININNNPNKNILITFNYILEHILNPDIYIMDIISKINIEKNIYVYIEIPNNKNITNIDGCLTMLIPEHIYLISVNGLLSLIDNNLVSINTHEIKTQRGHSSIVNFSKRRKLNV